MVGAWSNKLDTNGIKLANTLWVGWRLGGLVPSPFHSGKFYCLRQVHLAENLPQAAHTQNRVNTTLILPKARFAYSFVYGSREPNLSCMSPLRFGWL